ncbi:tetratricopeptide repeat protein [Pseudoalteromonas sp. SSDWG2]|uniref:tetratricopeptide repeat protein n=1 Tax=Pseudoalteromonas sp. SSDWG2 TaxID=3139391 RepID=UPI003BAC7D2D
MKIWLILQTILFESASLYLLGTQELTLVGWLSYAASHGAAAGTFTFLCYLALPNRYKLPVTSALAFIFVIAFSMPIVGMIGLATIFITALYFPKEHSKVLWKSSDVLELPLHPEHIEHDRYGAAALKDILLFNPSDERRQIAVNACRFLPERIAIPLLKIALTDKVDDVRLLAYAAIEKIEFSINRQIELLKREKADKRASMHFQIAELYWELCYLGIADGPLRLHYLGQAKQYLITAHQLTPSPRSALQLGKVLLELQQYDDAVKYLEEALHSGLLMKQVAPYLAEAAFAQGDYDHAALLVSHLPTEKGEALNELREFWRRERY